MRLVRGAELATTVTPHQRTYEIRIDRVDGLAELRPHMAVHFGVMIANVDADSAENLYEWGATREHDICHDSTQ
jgi:hypothetical protein